MDTPRSREIRRKQLTLNMSEAYLESLWICDSDTIDAVQGTGRLERLQLLLLLRQACRSRRPHIQ